MQKLKGISDYFKIAVFNYLSIPPSRITHEDRFWAFFPEQKAEVILSEYENGALKVVARDYVAAITRVKTQIFESERAKRAKDGGNYGPASNFPK